MADIDLKIDFDFVLKEAIVPFFKQLCFKKQGQNFARVTEDLVQCFNVQKSQWNSYNNSVSFTFNFGFYNAEIRRIAWNNEIQLSFPKITDCFIYSRAGIFSHGRDHWYELNARVDKGRVATDIVNDLENYIKPIFEGLKSLQDLTLFIRENQTKNALVFPPYNHIVLLMQTGQAEEGKFLLRIEYSKAVIPQTTTHTVNYPNGRSEIKKSKPYVNKHYIAQLQRLAEHYEINL